MEPEKKRLKVLYVITKSNWGGAQKYVYELATGLPKEKFEAVVMLGGEGELKHKLDQAGIRTISLSSMQRDVSVGKDAFSFFRLFRTFRKEKPDIVHLNSSKAGGLGSLAARLAGVPRVIFTAHGWAWNEDRTSFGKATIAFLHWVTMVLSHRIIVVSDYMKKQADAFPFVAGRIMVIHNGIATPDFLSRTDAREHLIGQVPEASRSALSETLSKEGALCVGTISELHKNKGLGYALESLARLQAESGLPPFAFIIIGEGEERASLEAKISELRLEGIAFLAGHQENAARYLKAFDMFTLTSVTEGLGYVLLEAGLASLPVLATKVGGIPEVVPSDEEGILVSVRNPKDTALGLRALLTDPALRASLSAKLHERVLREFSFERMLIETERLYSGL